MKYKSYILKKDSRNFLKLPPDHDVGLISQQRAELRDKKKSALADSCLSISRNMREGDGKPIR